MQTELVLFFDSAIERTCSRNEAALVARAKSCLKSHLFCTTQWAVGGLPLYLCKNNKQVLGRWWQQQQQQKLQNDHHELLKASNVVCVPDIVAVLLLDYSQPLKVCNE